MSAPTTNEHPREVDHPHSRLPEKRDWRWVPNAVAQTLGGAVIIGLLALVVLFGPKIMNGESWRFELLQYETDKTTESATKDAMAHKAANIDRINGLANLSKYETELLVNDYAQSVLPNASALVVAPAKFKQRWNESNARGALLENAILIDNDLVIFPAFESLYICTAVSVVAIVPTAMICAAMVDVYQRALHFVLSFVVGLHRDKVKGSANYIHTIIAKESLGLAASIFFAVFTLAQACVFGWLESGKLWKWKEVAFWGSLLFTGIGHSPVKPAYMEGIPQMTAWLSLCHFCMCLHTSASISLVITSVLRCCAASKATVFLPLTDAEMNKALEIDAKRMRPKKVDRPLYHN